MDAILLMPEVSTALHGTVNAQAVEGLKRSCDVFRQFSPKGEEYKAVLLLKAQLHSQLNQFQECIRDLSLASEICTRDDEQYMVLLARSKINWLSGKFSQAVQDADQIRNLALQVEFEKIPLYQGLALNASALSMMTEIQFKDADMLDIKQIQVVDFPNAQISKVSEVVDTLRMASNVLRNSYNRKKQEGDHNMASLALASSTSFINQGVAELMFSLIKSQSIGSYVSYDHAMQSFRESLNILDELKNFDLELSHQQRMLTKTLRVQAFSNMAWTLLNSSSYVGNDTKSLKESALKLASEYAGNALKVAGELEKVDDRDNSITQFHMSRALCLVASCYKIAGSAVTAEGLLRTAMDNQKKNTNPMFTINARSANLVYYKLCSSWEKRMLDAERAKQNALNLDKSLGNWEGMIAIYSGCSFLTLDELL